ncbi:MAG: saccharopine dehydrogenase NADP-binding domain-containing protein [Chloroflexota bacterium]
MKTGKFLIIGGYGSVGRIISTVLANQFPGRVVAAGRNIQKAENLSQETGGKALPLALDIFDPEVNIETALEGVSQVIMCLDQPDTRIVEQIIRKGVDYIDVTAASGFLEAMENLADVAKASGSSVVLSVGLVPGLTNLLATSAIAALDDLQHLDIFVMLGMGDAHGAAAIQWTLENINAEYTVLENGTEITVRSFEDGQRTKLPGIGERTAYRFNFPDQHSLPKTLGIDSVSSRLCFDLEIMTKAFAALKRAGMLRFLHRKWAKDLFIQGLRNLRIGSDQFALKVEASGRKNGDEIKFSSTVRGAGEARMTGLVAAQVAHRLYSGIYPAGVFHIEQLFEPQEFIHSISGVSFTQGIEDD